MTMNTRAVTANRRRFSKRGLNLENCRIIFSDLIDTAIIINASGVKIGIIVSIRFATPTNFPVVLTGCKANSTSLNMLPQKINKQTASHIQNIRSRQPLVGSALTNSSPSRSGGPTRRRASQNDSSSFKPCCWNPAMESCRCVSNSCRSSDVRLDCAASSRRQLSMAAFRSKRV